MKLSFIRRLRAETLRGLIAGMAILLTLTVGGATGLLLWRIEAVQRADLDRQQLSTARALSLAVDGRLQAYESLLAGLSEADTLRRSDWRGFDAKARRLMAGQEAWIIVADREGRQYVNTRLEPGAPLPSGAPTPWVWPVLDKGGFHVCDLSRGRLAPHVLCVDAPVRNDGRVTHQVSIMFLPRVLQTIIAEQRLGEGGIAAVIDRSGRVIWRNARPDVFVGAHATPDLRAAMRRGPEGVLSAESLDGMPMRVAFSRSKHSGWTFVLARPRPTSPLLAPQAGAFVVLVAAALALALAGGLLTARRITRAVRNLSDAAGRIRQGHPPNFKATGVREIDDFGEALVAAIAERDASDERFELAQVAGDIGAWEWDTAKDEGRVSGSYKRMHGLEDIEGPLRLGQVLHVIHRDDRAGYLQRLADATKRAEPSTNAYRVVAKDGETRWILSKGRPIFDGSGALVGAVGVVRDVTAEHAAQEAIRASRERLSLALAAGRMAVWEVDGLGRMSTDPAVNALIGLPPTATPTLQDLLPNYLPGELDRIRDAAREARNQGEPFFEVEFRYRRGDGLVRWLNIRAEVRYAAGGEPAGAIGIVMDVTERKADEERLRLLMREVDHRANNLLAVVQGTVALSSAPDAGALRAVISGRVQALARAHQLLSSSRWQGAALRQLVEEEVAPFTLGEDAGRIVIGGPDIPLGPTAAQGLAMALHELATNAAKHGALTAASGRVRVEWEAEKGWVRIRWTESGGPPVRKPSKLGFGTTVLDRALGGPIGGRTHLNWREAGLEVVLELPLGASTTS